ncbi:hypothetical protein OF83DRAFT_195910 [Amylostereum chailletii]|nr:hypothetical protein OF83DRAFT_195910 [Amylostereum chailletii]
MPYSSRARKAAEEDTICPSSLFGPHSMRPRRSTEAIVFFLLVADCDSWSETLKAWISTSQHPLSPGRSPHRWHCPCSSPQLQKPRARRASTELRFCISLSAVLKDIPREPACCWGIACKVESRHVSRSATHVPRRLANSAKLSSYECHSLFTDGGGEKPSCLHRRSSPSSIPRNIPGREVIDTCTLFCARRFAKGCHHRDPHVVRPALIIAILRSAHVWRYQMRVCTGVHGRAETPG